MYDVEDPDPLCCCEYFDRHQERNHIFLCCCQCTELDEVCERYVLYKFFLWGWQNNRYLYCIIISHSVCRIIISLSLVLSWFSFLCCNYESINLIWYHSLRFVSCKTVDRKLKKEMWLTVKDRLRIPYPGGARPVFCESFLPLVLILFRWAFFVFHSGRNGKIK